MKVFKETIVCETDNDFYKKNFETICKQLEERKAVELYCWCTGSTKCKMVINEYEKKLSEKYGEKLIKVRDIFNNYYYLK